jgi:hypothetical protein
VRFQVYSVERNIGSLLTTVKFRVLEDVGSMTRVKDDCSVTLEGVFEIDHQDLVAVVEARYKEEMGVS